MRRIDYWEKLPICLFVFSFVVFLAAGGRSQENQIAWTQGPETVDLGSDLAQIELGENYLFAGPEDTIAIMEQMGNPPSNNELGLVVPRDENAGWHIIFEYMDVGHVKDDDKDKIDADAILESIRQGTEEANKIRAENGVPPINVVGWYEEPHYDETTHNLVWTILGESSGRQVANYNTRLLGREGYMSVVLVAAPETLDSCLPEVQSLLADFSYKSGNKYSEFREGDKIAKYGLTALIAGGAGAVAAKAGIFKVLAKFGKFIIIGVIAFFAAFRKKLAGLFGRGGRNDDQQI